MRIPRLSAVALAASLTAACAGATSAPQPAPSPRPQSSTTSRPLDQAQAQRLQRVMVPLIRAMDNKRSLDQVRVGIVDNGQINAANAGGGEFYVTTGLLQNANEEQLQAILAHEVAHDDLGHVAKAQVLGAGLNIGVMILDQLFPGSAAITPIAGQLIARGHGRNEEYAADRHGVELLRRIGKPKEQMIETLTWLQQTAGASGEGGFFATHPATGDRIEALR